MTANKNTEDQKRLWIDLSELYLDTDLQPYHFTHLAKRIYESPFSYEEVREIDKVAVFPVLCGNLMYTIGVWDGFDEDWLVTSILKKKKKRNFLSRNYYNFMYFCMAGMFKEQWQKVENSLQELKTKD